MSTLIVTTPEDLERIVEAAVRRALEAVPSSEWMSASECADMLGVARSSLPKMVTREKLPGVRLGRGFRFRRADVVAWLEARATKPRGHTRKHRGTLLRFQGGR